MFDRKSSNIDHCKKNPDNPESRLSVSFGKESSLKMSENSSNDIKPQDEANENPYIKLKVKAMDSSEVHFKLKKATPFQKLITNYCKKMDVSTTSFRFTFEGARLDPDKTPMDYQMEDDDIIDVFTQQLGGQ